MKPDTIGSVTNSRIYTRIKKQFGGAILTQPTAQHTLAFSLPFIYFQSIECF
jgi:hypothetical protein